ncbi:hypothetical protein N8T08_010778 [Aspergillus melleus]|uniref:Uncharacterized protein n=1 Tax=Aspergillus melleus TaxID=138277 RepID=A0ACC3BBR0_9EURO|nr:hypothetical protein N8T08_010778 [Aspergillus melleus]
MASLLKGAAGAAKETTNIVLDLNKGIEKLFGNLAEQPQEVLRVYSWSDQTKTIQEKSCIAFKNADMSTTKLSDIRELLVTEGVLEPTSHAAGMSETQWSVVIRNNSLLNAYRVVDARGNIGRIVESLMHTAFALKPRLFQNYQISASAASDSIAKQKQTLRIPRFRIEDDSYIEQFEKTKTVSRAIAQSSPSQLAAELAVLDVSEKCQLDLASVNSVAAIDNFKDKYGRFFPTRIELGGRLHSSEESTASTTAGKADQAKSMRAAAVLSFSSPYVQASANMSYAQSSDSSSQNTGASTSKSVCWETKGGDTLLCNDPPAWAYTVGYFYNWRTVKQSRVLSIEDVISTTPGCMDTEQKFADILRDESQIKPTTSQTTIGFTLTMRNKKTFTEPQSSDGGKFAQTVYDLAKTKVMTEERMAYLNRLIPSIDGAAPVKLLANDNSTNQKFYVNVETTNINEDRQLKYNHPYRIYNKTNTGDGQSTWLVTSSILRGFIDTGIVWAGKLENATTFQLLYPGVGNHSPYVHNGDEVYLKLFYKDGKDYGYG